MPLAFAAMAFAQSRSGREEAAAAAAAFEQGRAKEAIHLMRRALDLEPTNAAYLAGLGQMYLSTGQPALAAPLLERSWKSAPGDIDVNLALAQAYQNLDRDLDALRTLGQKPPARPQQPLWLFLRGFSLFRSGRIDEARTAFRSLLAHAEQRPLARFFLANCHYVENDLEGALPYYVAAIQEGNTPANRALNAYYYNYGLALYRLRRFDEASGAFRQSVERFSRDPLPRFFLARCLTERMAHQEAIRVLSEVVEEFPDFPAALYQLARLHTTNGDKATGQELFRKYAARRERQQEDEQQLAKRIKLGR